MIGDTLRKEREKQKLSIQDVEKGTSIRAVYIDALEKGEYDKLPGEVYAKGFIKNYGNFLELDGESLVRQFVMEISPATAQIEDTQPENAKSEDKIAATNISQKYQTRQEKKAEENSDSKKYLAAAVAALAILIGGIFYGLSGSDSDTETPTVAQTETTPKPAPAAETPPAPVETQQVAQVQTPPPPPVNDVNLQATFSGDCWTRVIVDGAMVYEGMIGAGENFNWKGNQSVSVLLGNAGAAQFVMNGQNVGTIGGDGDVVEKTFTR
ncbi:MAG: helix-turn-helix domain-containing protein [Selenomonadaceae bacterium]|nr:helix-turn-helix domain-containing protein [Selenomonadaceae bacterium]